MVQLPKRLPVCVARPAGAAGTLRSHLFRSLGFSLRSQVMAQDRPTTVDEMQDLLAHLLEGAVGQTEAYWKNLIGPVIALPIVIHPRSNWRIDPRGKPADIEAIEKAAAVVREAHPYVPSPRTNHILKGAVTRSRAKQGRQRAT
jgi:hypothetical protein